VFDPWPRFVKTPMIWNDALRVGRSTVPAESESARRLTPVITSGRSRTAALVAAGVRYVVVDSGSLLGNDRRDIGLLAERAKLPGARVLLASPDLVLFRLPAGETRRPAADLSADGGNYYSVSFWHGGTDIPYA